MKQVLKFPTITSEIGCTLGIVRSVSSVAVEIVADALIAVETAGAIAVATAAAIEIADLVILTADVGAEEARAVAADDLAGAAAAVAIAVETVVAVIAADTDVAAEIAADVVKAAAAAAAEIVVEIALSGMTADQAAAARIATNRGIDMNAAVKTGATNVRIVAENVPNAVAMIVAAMTAAEIAQNAETDLFVQSAQTGQNVRSVQNAPSAQSGDTSWTEIFKKHVQRVRNALAGIQNQNVVAVI